VSTVEETPETPVEEPEGSSRAAGGCAAVVLAGIPLSVVDDPDNPHHSRVVWHARKEA
jgi:hypothetical protein